MANFSDIQTKLDNDPALAKQFLSDPIGVLRQHAVELSPQQMFEVQKSVAEVTRVGTPAAALPHIRIFIGIWIDRTAPTLGV
jgi:hypothetical protein